MKINQSSLGYCKLPERKSKITQSQKNQVSFQACSLNSFSSALESVGHQNLYELICLNLQKMLNSYAKKSFEYAKKSELSELEPGKVAEFKTRLEQIGGSFDSSATIDNDFLFIRNTNVSPQITHKTPNYDKSVGYIFESKSNPGGGTEVLEFYYPKASDKNSLPVIFNINKRAKLPESNEYSNYDLGKNVSLCMTRLTGKKCPDRLSGVIIDKQGFDFDKKFKQIDQINDEIRDLLVKNSDAISGHKIAKNVIESGPNGWILS